MTDLFARLAERALAVAGSSLSAPSQPEFGVSEEADEPTAEVRAPVEEAHDAPRGAAAPAPVAAAPEPAVAPAITAAVPSIVPPPREAQSVASPRPAAEREPARPPATVRAREVVRRETVLRERESAFERETTRELLRERIRQLAPVPPPPAPIVRRDDAHVAAAPAAPPVEVTIGRVEVRVRPPAAEPSRTRVLPAEPAPALSLDEYLRRRETPS